MEKKIITNSLDSFFSLVSKAVMIIPVFVLIISLFFKFNPPKIFSPPLNPVIPTGTPVVQNNSFKFDLKGPIVCDNLFIKDKKVLYKNKITNYLLNGDCLYIWEEGKMNGENICGLANYINMTENYLKLFNINDFINNKLAKDFIKNNNINVNDVINSCKREEIKNVSIFEVPEKVLFSNKK